MWERGSGYCRASEQEALWRAAAAATATAAFPTRFHDVGKQIASVPRSVCVCDGVCVY